MEMVRQLSGRRQRVALQPYQNQSFSFDALLTSFLLLSLPLFPPFVRARTSSSSSHGQLFPCCSILDRQKSEQSARFSQYVRTAQTREEEAKKFHSEKEGTSDVNISEL